MKNIFRILFAISVLFPLAFPAHAFAAEPRMVFAAYMGTSPTYGATLEGFKREIAEAQGLGIDGFIYYMFDWNLGARPKIFQAADELNSGFKIIMAPILGGAWSSDPNTGSDKFVDLIKNNMDDPSYYHFNGKPVVLSWEGEVLPQGSAALYPNIFNKLKNAGIDIQYLPFIGSTANNIISGGGAGFPTWFGANAGGFSYFGASRYPNDSIKIGQVLSSSMVNMKKQFFAGVSPYYYRARLTDLSTSRSWVEHDGGEGISAEWNSIIKVQKPQWVQIVTWNDFTESYMTPADPADPNFNYNGIQMTQIKPLLQRHNGYSEYMKYYISWFKTGVQPPITKDTLYYFYRIHSKNLKPSNDTSPIGLYGNIQDNLYITTMLTAPAVLSVSSGAVVTNKTIAAGIHFTQIPFKAGKQIFSVIRNGNTLMQTEGTPILSSIATYNFIPTTGYVTSSAAILSPTPTPIPGDLTDAGDVPGDEVNIFDYNLVLTNFGNPYTIFDYNDVVGNFSK